MTRRHLIKNLHDDIKFKAQLETALAGGEPVLLPTVFNEGTEDERVFWSPLETRYIPNWLRQTTERIEFWKKCIATRDAKRAQKTK